jgi:pyridoxal phosphate phosphatase PHOSPHO2
MALPLLRPMIVLDFDWTLLDCNSDTWVVEKLGASALMNSLHHTLPWTQLMNDEGAS